jgi:preflagellin peptidase FlaK
MNQILDIVRIFVCLVFLIYASWTDYKTREVSNTVWILFAPPALTLSLIDLFLSDFSMLIFYGISVGLTSAFAVILFYSGAFGGADAKALMCIALALPFYPQNIATPLSEGTSPISQIFFPVTVFSNSVLLAALTAIYILLRNTFWRLETGMKFFEGEQASESFGRKLLVLMTGYKITIAKLKEKWHLYPLEDIEGSEDRFKRKLVLIPKDEGRDEIVERLEKAHQDEIIKDKVWASPGLPMLIFITIGLIIALILGDIVWIGVGFLLK